MNPTILFADDDPALLKAVSIRLNSYGYKVITAADSYQAVQFAKQHEPDVIVLDIGMPAGDGFTVQERLQSGGVTAPVIYLTGNKSAEARSHAERLGAHALLHKPFDDVELVAVIQEALDARVADAA